MILAGATTIYTFSNTDGNYTSPPRTRRTTANRGKGRAESRESIGSQLRSRLHRNPTAFQPLPIQHVAEVISAGLFSLSRRSNAPPPCDPLSPARFAAETSRGQRFSASGLTFYDRESFPDRVRYRPDRICTAQSVAGLKRVMIAARSPSNPINLPASRVDGAAREDPSSPGTVIFLFPRRGMRCIGNQECPLTAEK